jgi:hypothetical protein
MPSRLRFRTLTICLALGTSALPAFAGPAADGPIVLTNEDVERLKNSATGGGQSERGSGLIIAPEADAALSAERSGPPATPSAGNHAPSWQEEYYRLKTLALQRAMEQGNATHFGDVADGLPARRAPPAAAPASSARPSYASTGPSCMYGTNGELIHGPSGMDCSTVRVRGAATHVGAAGQGQAICLYGIHGEVLHAPPGRDCKSRTSGTLPVRRP